LIVGEVLEVESGDEAVEIFGGIQREAAKKDRAVFGGLLQELAFVLGEPIGGGVEGGGGGLAFEDQRERSAVMMLLAGD